MPAHRVLERASLRAQREQLGRLRPLWQKALSGALGQAKQSRREAVLLKVGIQELAGQEFFLCAHDVEAGGAGMLVQLHHAQESQRDAFFLRLGAHQTAEAVRPMARRDMALFLHRIGEPVAGWMVRDLRATRSLHGAEHKRIHEAVTLCQRHHPQGNTWIKHVGLFFAVVAAGRAHAVQADSLGKRLKQEDRAQWMRFLVHHGQKSRPLLEDAVWHSVNALLSTWSIAEARHVE